VTESAHAEATRREIDIEVKRLVDDANRVALETLTEKRDVLDRLSADLYEMETMTAEHMHSVIDSFRRGPALSAGTSGIAMEPVTELKPPADAVEAEARSLNVREAGEG
jgi:hypothetical protein